MQKGFWDTPSAKTLHLTLKLGLIHSEVSEALEVLRDKYDGEPNARLCGMTDKQAEDFVEELADVIIRTLDIAAHYHWDIHDVIVRKMDANTQRPRLHAKNF